MEGTAQDSPSKQVALDALAPILASARKAKFNKSGVAAVAQVMKSSGIDPHAAVLAALAEHDRYAAAVLIVGASMNGYRPEPGELGEILPVLPDMEVMAPLIGCCSGDRLKMLIEALESGRLSWQREVFVCLIAVELLGDSPPPPNLLTAMRLLARENLPPETGVVLGCAARSVRDSATREVARIWIDLAERTGADFIVAPVRKMLATAPTDVMPEDEIQPFAGSLLRRAAPTIGRNEPCHCGSGRKYKKCCANKDAARLADPSPVRGVTMAEYAAHPEEYLDRDQLDNLSVREVARLDFSRLKTTCLIAALRLLTTHRFWAEAEAAMAAVSSRTDLPMEGTADQYRVDLVHEALKARARDVVERQVAKIQDQNLLEDMRIDLDLFSPGPETLRRMDDVVREQMRELERGKMIDLAYALLDQYPGLGILVARGVLDPDRALDMEYLLEEVERARDRLQLPPGDIAHDLYEHLLGLDLDALEFDGEEDRDTTVAKLTAAAAQQRAQLKEASAKAASLEKKLRTQEGLLRKVKAEKAPQVSATQKDKLPNPTPTESEEIRRLRNKVEELKGLIAESHKERSALRVKLAAATTRIEKTASNPEGNQDVRHPSSPEEPQEAAELDAAMPSRWSTLVPFFRNGPREAIRGVQPQLARQALQMVAALAAGDQSAWTGIKRLRALPDVWSARIGLHYRLLFRLDSARSMLEVTAFIHRRDLESTIAKGGL